MKSQVVKRSIVIDGHKTSVSLEDAFWTGLREIAQAQHATLSKLVGENRQDAPTRQPVFSDPLVRSRSSPQVWDKRGE